MSVNGPDGVFAYDYDAFGNRRSMTVDGAKTEFLIDPTSLVNVAAEYGPGGTVRYTSGVGLVSRVGASTSYYDFDATGNTVGMTDASGGYENRYGYLPFGEETASRRRCQTCSNSTKPSNT